MHCCFLSAASLDVISLDGGLDAGEALESPGCVGDLFEEVVFECVEGPDVGAELIEFVLVLDGVLAGDDWMLGPKSVFERVLCADLFALLGLRTGGEFCVVAVCLKLLFCRHSFLDLSWAFYALCMECVEFVLGRGPLHRVTVSLFRLGTRRWAGCPSSKKVTVTE